MSWGRMIPGMVILAGITAVAGCGGVGSTVFLHPEYNFAYVERVAVLPFENLSQDHGAGARATRFFVSDLLATKTFDVVEPGEVTRVLGNHNILRAAELTEDQAIQVGQELKAQGLILGSVGEATATRAGGTGSSVVTLVVRMVETDKGTTVWSATTTEKGRGFWGSLFGGGQRPESEVTRRCVDKAIRTLIK